MAEDLVLKVARRRVERFAIRPAAPRDIEQDANECAACERWLDMGVDALEWLEKAEQFLLEAGRSGVAIIESDTAQAVRDLYLVWLESCDQAEKWCASLTAKGHPPNNLGKLRQANARAAHAAARNAILQMASRPVDLDDDADGCAQQAGATTIRFAPAPLEPKQFN